MANQTSPTVQRDLRMFSPPGGGAPKRKSEFTGEELLWLHRTIGEGEHRYGLHLWQIDRPFRPSIQAVIDDPDGEVGGTHLETSCNKTVPMYFLPSLHREVVVNIMENYIYRRWFRPYRTETTADQFLCKFIMAQDLDGCNAPPSEAAISALATFHGILCAKTEECWRESRAHHARWVEEDPVGANSWSIKVPRHESHLLRPLFRALMAIVCCADYDGEDSTTAGRFPVCLVRTGVEDGLSAPISFHAEVVAHRMKYLSDNVVETTLEAAVDFIMALEAREAAVFGIQPDPASVVEVPMDEEGHELTRLPSTQWVSDEKAAEWGWCGKGRYWDEVWGARFEQRAFRSHKSLLFELQMLREGRELPATLTIGDLTTVFRTEKGEGKDSVSAD